MANEIYDSTWFGKTLETAKAIGTKTEYFSGQFELNNRQDCEAIDCVVDWTRINALR